MAVCKRLAQFGANSIRGFSYGSLGSEFAKPNGNRAFLVDTLALVIRLTFAFSEILALRNLIGLC